jgi:hypothetical protein
VARDSVRRTVDFTKRAYSAATSTGAGYERQPPGRYFDTDAVRGYFVDYRTKTTGHFSEEPNPVDLAQRALGFWELGLEGVAGATDRFEEHCERLAADAERAPDGMRWPYHVPVRKYDLRPPWYSAMAQAQVASAFVRLHVLRGDDRAAQIAVDAVGPLLGNAPEFVTTIAEGPVLEELPTEAPSHVLNGWIFALWGLRDVAVGLGHTEAHARYTESLDCLRRNLHRYDVGWWTRYSLYPHRLPDLAKPFYHQLHIDQVDVVYRLSGIAEFDDARRRWKRYDTHVRRFGAVLYKVPFVLSEPASHW